jgi:hypothetical protein
VLWEFRNALEVFPLFLMGKIVLTYDQPSGSNLVGKSSAHCSTDSYIHVFIYIYIYIYIYMNKSVR